MSATVADAKILMLRRSMRSLVYGLLSFLPILGFGFAVVTFKVSWQAWSTERQLWNAARSYRIAGMICAILASIFWTVILVLIVWNIAHQAYS